MLDVITNMQNVALFLREQRNQEQQRLSAIQSSTHSRKRGEAGATASATLPPLHPPPQDQWLMVTETAAPEVEEEHANVDRRCRIGTRLLVTRVRLTFVLP